MVAVLAHSRLIPGTLRPNTMRHARVALVQGFSFRSFNLNLFLFLLQCDSLRRRCRSDGEIHVKNASQDSDANAQALKIAKSWMKEEEVENEIIDHSKVAKHLKFACGLALERVEFCRLGTNNTKGHSHQHNPVNRSEDAWVIEKGLVQGEHGCASKDGLDNVCPGCQR